MNSSDRAPALLKGPLSAIVAAFVMFTAAAPAPPRAASALRDIAPNSVIVVGSASCDYCTDEIAELRSLHARNRGVKITAFLEGSAADVRTACSRRGADFPCIAISAAELRETVRAENGAEPIIRVRSARGMIATFHGSTNLRRILAALEDRS